MDHVDQDMLKIEAQAAISERMPAALNLAMIEFKANPKIKEDLKSHLQSLLLDQAQPHYYPLLRIAVLTSSDRLQEEIKKKADELLKHILATGSWPFTAQQGERMAANAKQPLYTDLRKPKDNGASAASPSA